MKFIGQFIQDFIARFRNDVYLEDISTGTIASGGNLGLDSNNKIVKADTNAGELSITNATDNRVVTSTGGTDLNAESGLTFSTFLTLDGSTADVKIGSDVTPFGYNPDVITNPYGQMSFVSYAAGGTGIGGLIEQSDLSAGTNTGAPLGIKAGGSFGSNKAGGNLELIAGRGTGTGAGGSFRFWSSTAGSSGSSYNTSAVKFTIDSDGDVDITGGATVAGLINATSGATMLGNSYLVFSDSDNSNTTRVRSSTTSTNRTIFFPDADGTVALTTDITSDGWHGSTTRIKILPRDFVANDGGRPVMIEDDNVGSNALFLFSNGSFDMFACIPIPTGYKATHVKVNGTDTSQNFYVYQGFITSRVIVDVATGTTAIGTEKALSTQVTSDTTNYLIVRVTSDGSTDEIYGGYVTIAAV